MRKRAPLPLCACGISSIGEKSLMQPVAGRPATSGVAVEGFFFSTVVVRAGLAAKAPDVVERLVAIPAGAFRLEVGHARADRRLLQCRLRSFRVSTFVDLVCITHDSAAMKTNCQAASCGRDDKSIDPTGRPLKSMAKKWRACRPALKSPANKGPLSAGSGPKSTQRMRRPIPWSSCSHWSTFNPGVISQSAMPLQPIHRV
jgi:hypothetical protein